MTRRSKEEMLRRIGENIQQYGFHVNLIQAKMAPRFAYTVGLGPRRGAELVLAGAAWYSDEEVKRIIDRFGTTSGSFDTMADLLVDGLGTFSLTQVHMSWTEAMLLASLEYYGTERTLAYQILPDAEHHTVDVPNLSLPREPGSDPVWRWLTEVWDLPVPSSSTAVTNIAALRGETVTEVVRWEEDQWEVFAGAGPEVPPDLIRRVPLGTLLGADVTLGAIVRLAVGQGLWRDADDRVWHNWD